MDELLTSNYGAVIKQLFKTGKTSTSLKQKWTFYSSKAGEFKESPYIFQLEGTLEINLFNIHNIHSVEVFIGVSLQFKYLIFLVWPGGLLYS